MAEKKKTESLWERAKKRVGEEVELLKNTKPAFADAEAAEENISYSKKKRKPKSE